jgi:chromosomal replication initiator protein
MESRGVAMDAGVSILAPSTTLTPAEGVAGAMLWESIHADLRDIFGEAIYRNWLMPLAFRGIASGQAILSAPTRFMREWVVVNYAEKIKELFQQQDPSVFAVEVIVSASESPAEGSKMLTHPTAAVTVSMPFTNALYTPMRPHHAASGSEPTSALLDRIGGAALDPRYTFDNFVVGKPNELAFAAARRVAESRECISGCNPLFLYGGVGLGKTHLMHAIAWHLRHTNPERRVVYLSAEKFMYQFIKALRFNETMAFKEQFRSVDVLMVDDVQFISGKDSTQEEFFHTFNALIDQNKQLVISADRSPSDLEGMEERIRSRLGWGLVADIHATSFELRYGILQSKVEQMPDTQVPAEVIEFLARRITTNIRELEGSLNRVVAHGSLIGRPITLESTQELLQDLLRSCDRRVTIEEIQKRVAEYYNVKVSDMHSARRSVTVARPRQMAMYLAKQLTSRSLPEIGRKFGGKDHTTVMHAVKRIEELAQKDNELREDIGRLKRMMGG